MWLRWAVLDLHLAAAIFWIGEMMFLAVVVGPYSRTLPPRQRRELFVQLGRRSRPYAWTAIAVLLVTGVANMALMGIAPLSLLDPALWRTTLGGVLALKVLAVGVLLVLVALHDVVLVARSARVDRRIGVEGPSEALVAEAARLRRWASWLGRVNLVLALIVAFLGTGLTLGG